MPDMLHDLTLALLSWYDQNKRSLPWRSDAPDTYHVWLSEVMLQQTTVPAVIPYFLKFIDLYPTVHDLAAAPEADVMGHWAGLGYYSRARNLMKAAKEISSFLSSRRRPGSTASSKARQNDHHVDAGLRQHDEWREIDLESLPGVGRYTAAAINTIAFNKPDVVVDGNVERIISRLYAVDTPLPAAKKELYALSVPLYDHHHGRSGALAQAFMDLGSLICLPKNPKCDACPIQKFCKAQSDTYPKRAKKEAKPHRTAICYWIENGQGEVLFERRPDTGLLGGTIGLPCTDLKTGEMPEGITVIPGEQSEGRGSRRDIRFPSPHAAHSAGNDDILGVVKHVFTHFVLTMTIERARVKDFDASRYFWAKPEEVKGGSSLFKRVLQPISR